MAATSPPPPRPPNSYDVTPRPRATPPGQPPIRRTTYRSGRLGVDKQGEYTYKNTPSSTLMASLQLGLHVSIGSIEPKPRRDILMTDFEVVDTVDFPADGSTITPAHKHRDFTFKTYSPVAFRFFREAFGILAEDYLLAMCAHPLREISNPGASGSLFYLSADDAFILKTVQKKEAHFLQKLLPGYYLNLTQNKKTLLPKFFGLYRYKCGTVNIRIAVMNNLLPSTLKYHEKYDLKGSSYKRKAVGDELGKSSPTFKDLDFQERNAEGGGVYLLPDKYEILMKTLDRDCKVLESFGIMDYSLLLGVYNIDQTRRDGETSSRTNSPGGDGKEEDRHTLVPSRIELGKNFSIISVENIPLAIQGEEAADTSRYPQGYIQGKMKGDRVLVYLGIIDILQSYRLKKKVEHTFKSMITDGSTVSVHNPTYYARRFFDFLEKKVFQKEKVSRRARKASKVLGGNKKTAMAVVTGSVVRTQSMPHSRDRYHSQQSAQKRVGPLLSPTFLSSPPPGDGASPGKSNLKQSSQFDRKRAVTSSESTSSSILLPEIPTIEVFVVETSDSEEVGGPGGDGKLGKLPSKGVRFADMVDSAEKEKKESEPKPAPDEPAEEEASNRHGEEREAMEMDSVDFDKVTGTSTPILEDSPKLSTKITITTITSQTTTTLDGGDASTEGGEREHVIEESAGGGDWVREDGVTTSTNKNETASVVAVAKDNFAPSHPDKYSTIEHVDKS